MSISDILAIRNLLPGGEPDLLSLRPDENKKPFKFRDKADEEATLAEVNLILRRLYEEYGHNHIAATEAFHDILEDDKRLQAAVIKAACREMCEDPRIKKLMAKQQRAKTGVKS